MKIILCTLSFFLICFASVAQSNPGNTMREPNYYQDNNPLAVREAGRSLQKFTTQFYIGTGIQIGGTVLASLSNVDMNNPNQSMAAVGAIMMVAGTVVQLISFKHVGKAGRLLENGTLSNLKIQGSSSGMGLGLAYNF